jgi:TolB-like protein/DNA-binding winged helix-turn-helix (wHTH) protein
METSSSLGQVIGFGPFEINLRTGELRKRGIRLALQEQPLKILAALLEQPGEVVTREDLCRRLWPNGTFVDFEHSLNAAVRRLRIALGDEAETPKFVETVHRRGYRFLAWNTLGPRHQLGAPETKLSGVGVSAENHAIGPQRRVRVAVLPFISLESDDCTTWFAEGLTEEMTTQLARHSPAHVGVLARSSVMRFATSEHGAAGIGQVLGADYLIEGSVRRSDDRVRIIAQLIESRSETHLWAATYDRAMTDPLTAQTKVADAIARAVSLVLIEISAPPRMLSREAAS